MKAEASKLSDAEMGGVEHEFSDSSSWIFSSPLDLNEFPDVDVLGLLQLEGRVESAQQDLQVAWRAVQQAECHRNKALLEKLGLEVRYVSLKRREHDGAWGITLETDNRHVLPVAVVRSGDPNVVPIRSNEAIIETNGTSVLGWSHEQIVNWFKQFKGTAQIGLCSGEMLQEGFKSLLGVLFDSDDGNDYDGLETDI